MTKAFLALAPLLIWLAGCGSTPPEAVSAAAAPDRCERGYHSHSAMAFDLRGYWNGARPFLNNNLGEVAGLCP